MRRPGAAVSGVDSMAAGGSKSARQVAMAQGQQRRKGGGGARAVEAI
jgi:hypothetical protein